MQRHVQYCLVNLCSLLSIVRPISSSGSSPTKPLGVSLPSVCSFHSACTVPLILQALYVCSALIDSGPEEVSPWPQPSLILPHPEDTSFCEL